jgi:hypothetical protein
MLRVHVIFFTNANLIACLIYVLLVLSLNSILLNLSSKLLKLALNYL